MLDLLNTMDLQTNILEELKAFGVGHRKLDDALFLADKPPARLGVYDLDDETLCYEIIKSTCNVPGCTFTAESLLDFENHYNASHRYSCGQCKKVLPSPHLLDLHIQETHDSFFAVLAERKPSYCCYIENCKDKFKNANDRLDHCVKEHRLPRDFRFESKGKNKTKKSKGHKNVSEAPMDEDKNESEVKPKVIFNNSKQKTFPKYTGRTFTKSEAKSATQDVNMDELVSDLKDSLPE